MTHIEALLNIIRRYDSGNPEKPFFPLTVDPKHPCSPQNIILRVKHNITLLETGNFGGMMRPDQYHDSRAPITWMDGSFPECPYAQRYYNKKRHQHLSALFHNEGPLQHFFNVFGERGNIHSLYQHIPKGKVLYLDQLANRAGAIVEEAGVLRAKLFDSYFESIQEKPNINERTGREEKAYYETGRLSPIMSAASFLRLVYWMTEARHLMEVRTIASKMCRVCKEGITLIDALRRRGVKMPSVRKYRARHQYNS